MNTADKIGTSIGAVLDRFGIRSYARWEFALMRAAFAALVISTFPTEKHLYATQDFPNGLAHFTDLTFLADPNFYRPLEILAYVAVAIYVIGVLPVLPLAYLTWFSIATKTLANSQGGISHSFQMVSLILLAQFLVALCALLVPLAKHGKFPLFQNAFWDSCAIYYSQIAIAGAYVVAAVTKLHNSGLAWFWNSPFLAMDLIKTDRQNYYAALDGNRFGSFGEEVAYVNFITENPNLARVLFSPGILLELAAVLALLGRRWALAIGLSLVALHLGIKEVMKLDFLKNEICVTIFFINIPFWIFYAARRARGNKVELRQVPAA